LTDHNSNQFTTKQAVLDFLKTKKPPILFSNTELSDWKLDGLEESLSVKKESLRLLQEQHKISLSLGQFKA